MPSRAGTSFLLVESCKSMSELDGSVNALTGWYLISTERKEDLLWKRDSVSVNALTGWYLISTASWHGSENHRESRCQCPHGMVPHFYGEIR